MFPLPAYINGQEPRCHSLISDLYIPQERISNVAYNVVNGICTPVNDQSAPVYITIGDGGNLEGVATKYVYSMH